MTATNIYLFPLLTRFAAGDDHVVSICKQMHGMFLYDAKTTLNGSAAWRLWVRADRATA